MRSYVIAEALKGSVIGCFVEAGGRAAEPLQQCPATGNVTRLS